jgi:flavin-binding protein dodecin
MSNHHTYKKLEIVGTSTNSIEEAIENAITETAKSVNNIDWFEVTETRGHIMDNKVAHYQVTLKIGFRIEAS